MKQLAQRVSVDRHRPRRHLRPLGRRLRDRRRDVPLSRTSSRSASPESGNHDNRVYEDDWAEKWQGLLESKPDGTTNYDNQANQNFAKNLKGKLLLAHGTMDNNVPPYNTLLVVDALIKANKDFDLLMLPNRGARLRQRAAT